MHYLNDCVFLVTIAIGTAKGTLTCIDANVLASNGALRKSEIFETLIYINFKYYLNIFLK